MADSAGIIRKSFGLKDQIRPELEASYNSPLIDKLRQEGHRLTSGRFTIALAEEFGFCYGVDRAIDYAYQTKAKFPEKRIFLTNEIIHNQRVNSKLCAMGVEFLSGPYAGGASLEDIGREDVVIIPAFGTPIAAMDELQKKECILVDTTCGSVMSVWKRVESYLRDGVTSVIHGKYDHEETLATSSRAGTFLVVRDKEETRFICDYIEGRQNREMFYRRFAPRAMSAGFDPDRDLQRIGCANQTTMLSSESMEIASMLREAVAKRYGEEKAGEHFRHFDTICSATQDRQDAIKKLLDEGVDIMVVVGGYNSSNTGHLVEISAEKIPAYHVKDADCIVSHELIHHKKAFGREILETRNWLPKGHVRIGVTAGASTPNRLIEEVIDRILSLKD